MNSGPPERNVPPGPLFVVGIWRSGTSALYALLNQHPQIALLFEGDLHLLSSRFLFPVSNSKLVRRWDFWNGGAKRHRVNAAQIPEGLRTVQDALHATYAEFAARKGAIIVGEKSPNYYDRLTHLADEFPGAKFLIIWRNPMNVCASIFSARDDCFWFARRGMVNRALLGFRELKHQCDSLLQRGAPVHQVSYEELVHNPPAVMRGICSFLGIDYEPRMTTLDGADVSSIYPEKHHSGVRRESIHLKPERTYVVPASVRHKIKRYISEWKQVYGGTWPPYPRFLGAHEDRPRWSEKIFDAALYRVLRAYDKFILVVYGLAPLAVLQRYRDAKCSYRQVRRSGRFMPKWMPTWLRPGNVTSFGAQTPTQLSDGNLPANTSQRTYASGR